MKSTKEVKIQNFEKGHLGNVVALHEACFTNEDNFAMRFGHAFVCTTYQFFLDEKKSFGFVAMCDGKVVGVLVGRLDYYTSALNKYRFSAAIKGLICNPSLLFSKPIISQMVQMVTRPIFHKAHKKKLKSALSHQDGGTATLASFCTHPDYRNLRIGDKLLSHAEEFCRRNNMQYLRAGIRRSNVASRFTYRSRGYIEDEILSGENDLLYYLPLHK